MWPFRRRARPEPTGTYRLGGHSPDVDDYTVLTVSESRHPATFDAIWGAATAEEREAGMVRRWAVLVPVRDPKFGVADLAVQFDGQAACYLRPPHLGLLARRIDDERVATLEVPGLIEWGPAGPSVRLLVASV